MFASKAKMYQGVRGRKKQINAKKNRELRELRNARPKNGPVPVTAAQNDDRVHAYVRAVCGRLLEP